MNKLFGAAAVALLIATPALAENMAPQAPTEQAASATTLRHDQAVRHEGALRTAHRRSERTVSGLAAASCPADSTNEAGLATHPGGYCMPGGRS